MIIFKNNTMQRCVVDLPGATHFELFGDMNWFGCFCDSQHGLTRKELEEYLGPTHPFHPDWKPKE